MRGEKIHALGIVCRHNGEYIAIGIKLHLVDTHLTIEAMHATRQVVAVIDDVVFARRLALTVVYLKNGVMTRAMDGLVGIGLKDASLVFKWSHGARCRCGILHPIGVVVAGTRRIGEIIDAIAFEYEWSLEDVL